MWKKRAPAAPRKRAAGELEANLIEASRRLLQSRAATNSGASEDAGGSSRAATWTQRAEHENLWREFLDEYAVGSRDGG